MTAGQRGANQGPVTLSFARRGLAGDRLSEAAKESGADIAREVQGSSQCVIVHVF